MKYVIIASALVAALIATIGPMMESGRQSKMEEKEKRGKQNDHH